MWLDDIFNGIIFISNVFAFWFLFFFIVEIIRHLSYYSKTGPSCPHGHVTKYQCPICFWEER